MLSGATGPEADIRQGHDPLGPELRAGKVGVGLDPCRLEVSLVRTNAGSSGRAIRSGYPRGWDRSGRFQAFNDLWEEPDAGLGVPGCFESPDRRQSGIVDLPESSWAPPF